MVFCRETGIKDDDDEVEARDGACSMETAMAGDDMDWWDGGTACILVEECGPTGKAEG